MVTHYTPLDNFALLFFISGISPDMFSAITNPGQVRYYNNYIRFVVITGHMLVVAQRIISAVDGLVLVIRQN